MLVASDVVGDTQRSSSLWCFHVRRGREAQRKPDQLHGIYKEMRPMTKIVQIMLDQVWGDTAKGVVAIL